MNLYWYPIVLSMLTTVILAGTVETAGFQPGIIILWNYFINPLSCFKMSGLDADFGRTGTRPDSFSR